MRRSIPDGLAMIHTRLAKINPDELMALWDALAQYVGNRQDAEETPDDAPPGSAPLAVAEKLLNEFDAVFGALAEPTEVK